MIEVYIYGCTTCGVNALLLGRVKKQHGDVTVLNSAQIDNRRKHTAYLVDAGIETKNYPPIIVINGGERIIRLAEWKLL
jgi:hypothetical protein